MCSKSKTRDSPGNVSFHINFTLDKDLKSFKLYNVAISLGEAPRDKLLSLNFLVLFSKTKINVEKTARDKATFMIQISSIIV